jgi:hypothetical protein
MQLKMSVDQIWSPQLPRPLIVKSNRFYKSFELVFYRIGRMGRMKTIEQY